MSETSTNAGSDTEKKSKKLAKIGSDPTEEEVKAFLSAFKTRPNRKPKEGERAAVLPNPASHSVGLARDAYWEGDWLTISKVYTDKKTGKSAKDEIQRMILEEDGGRQGLVEDTMVPQLFLSSVDPKFLDESDLLTSLRGSKNEVISSALLGLAQKKAARLCDGPIDRDSQLDPELFTRFVEEIGRDELNDTGRGLGQPKRGLGPRLFSALLENGGFDQVCELIDMGVDTTVPARTKDSEEAGAYSGFVMPLQHSLQKYIREVGKIGTSEAAQWDDAKREEIKGAKKVLDKLAAEGIAESLTTWKDVQESELVEEFRKNPGTIWGFEEMRRPFVQAAHEKDEGARPVRMMELWDATLGLLSGGGYKGLTESPEKEIKKAVDYAVTTMGRRIDKEDFYTDVRPEKEQYLEHLRVQASNFLKEYSEQMPRGSFARISEDDAKQPLSNIAGIDMNKFMGSFACKAGLWSAKTEGKPVYYCLDGIKMDDAVNYKKAKNTAVEEFIAAGGSSERADTHKEVVTMKEVREILRNWNELKDTVKFVQKGKIMKGQEVEDFVTEWKQKVERANEKAGRMPAPPRANFTKELAAIDADLTARFKQLEKLGVDAKELDMDARDIVRKAGYLLQVSNTNPAYVVKYLMSKCEVLVTYDLIPGSLVSAAATLGKLASLDEPVKKGDLKTAAVAVEKSLAATALKFRAPLYESLVRHSFVARSKRLKKMKI